jgi:L-rhamnose isomerase/sugar isomerase
VRPLLAEVRRRLGVEPDPVETFRRGGFAERLARERGTVSAESAYERI